MPSQLNPVAGHHGPRSASVLYDAMRSPYRVALHRHTMRALLKRPVGWCIVCSAITVVLTLLVSADAAYPAIFACDIALAAIGALVYAWEACSLYPMVARWKPERVHFASRHDPKVLVECRAVNVRLHRSASARAAFEALVLFLAPVVVVLGVVEYTGTNHQNYGIDMGWWTQVGGLGALWVVGTVRLLRRRLCHSRAGRAALANATRADGAALAAGHSRSDLRVMQLNVSSCVGADGRLDVHRVASMIVTSGAHVVALQEVERCARVGRDGDPLPLERSQVDQLLKLAEVSGMHVQFCNKTTAFGGLFGNAILSRFPVFQAVRYHYTTWQTHSSDDDDAPLPQCALAVRVRPPGFTHDLWVVSTQLGSDAAGVEQLNEMSELVSFLRALPGAAMGVGLADRATGTLAGPAGARGGGDLAGSAAAASRHGHGGGHSFGGHGQAGAAMDGYDAAGAGPPGSLYGASVLGAADEDVSSKAAPWGEELAAVHVTASGDGGGAGDGDNAMEALLDGRGAFPHGTCVPANVVVCGDFRVPDSSPTIGYASLCGLVDVTRLPAGATGMGSGATYPSDRPTRHYDRIMLNDKGSLTFLSARLLPDMVSEHLPLVVDLAEAASRR